jgi:hypothetical protein
MSNLFVRGLTGLAAVCALGAVTAPYASADESPAKVAVPGADLVKTAAKFRQPLSEVLQRQARLAPVIEALAPARIQPVAKPRLKATKIAKASIDECFKAVGDTVAPDAQGNCAAGYRPKRNQDYVFGSYRSGDYMYFGTLTAAVCGAVSGAGYGINVAQPFAGDELACEFNQGWAARTFGWKALGDNHRPQIVRVNADTNQAEDITPSRALEPALDHMWGLRGGGAHNDVVLFGGNEMNDTATGYRGVHLFAFEGSTGRYLGSKLLPEYANIRRGNVIDGDLYFGVRLSNGANGTGGAVVKWTGDKTDPFQFEAVANNLPSEPGYITGHEHHIITSGFTTIKGNQAGGAIAEMYQSPEIPAGGLTSATADPSNWKSIFKMSDYDPDAAIANAINFGDLISFKGKLMFSTYVYGGFPTFQAYARYGKPADEQGRLNTVLNAERQTAIFSMDNVGTPNQKVRLLYGEAKLPVYNTATKQWERKANNLRQLPAFGPSGFGNRFNYYSWMWEKYKGSLYMSTFDASSMARVAGTILGPAFGISDETMELLKPVLNVTWTVLGGADVWRLDDPNLPAVPETLNGWGNKNAHGVRGWAAFEDKNKLMAGMATWANLNNTAQNAGGWEVNELKG